MRNMCLGLTAFVVSVGMVSVGAQGRNFSGTWVIDSEKTMAAMQVAVGEMTGAVVARSGGGGGRGGVVTAGGGGGVAGTGSAVARSGGSGGGVAVGASTGAVARSGGGGGRGGVMVSSDTVISIDATTFTTDIGGVQTSYPLNGSEVAVQLRGTDARARASWKGDTLVISTTIESQNGPVTSTTSWYLEGDSLVRETTRKTYYRRK